MRTQKVLEIGKTFPVNDKLAGLVPLPVKAEQEALAQDIFANGLREPVVLWKGEIVDGRSRQNACVLMNVAVCAIDLDDELEEKDVATYVKSVNTRRNLTLGQKIMAASKQHSEVGSKSLDVIAKSWGISKSILIRANYIAKKRPEFIEPLFNGKTVQIVDAKGNQVLTNKISAIYAHIRREEEDVTEAPSYEWSANSHIHTQRGKDWYFEVVTETGTKNMRVLMELADLANYKFENNNTPVPLS
jgi:hypothetical protein